MAVIGIATNAKILTLYNQMKANELILQPSFQRKLVWNDAHRENFMATILKGFPFPEIYLAAGDINLGTMRGTQLVVDGQQRLDTIRRYIDGDATFIKAQPKFTDLTSEQKTALLDYQVVVRDLGRIDDEKIKEIFGRINSVQYALNAVELSSALYDGEFITAADKVASTELFQAMDVFTLTESSRMKDKEFVLLVMATLEAGYFSQSKEVEEYTARYDNEYPRKDVMPEAIIRSLRLIHDTGLQPDSIWYRKSSFFTLLVELTRILLDGKDIKPDALATVLRDMEERILANKNSDDPENQYAQYYSYVYQNTQGRKGRLTRARLVAPKLAELAT